MTVPLDDLPDWLPAWCLDHLGAEPVGVLFQVQQVSMVFGLRLAGGSDVELEIAWAASVWMAAYNAREQALFGAPQLSGDALRAQGAERFRRASA